MKLLALSNGHGEDEVAVRVLRQFQQLCSTGELRALPLVGEGRAYSQANIQIYGSVRSAMPSGGFIYMDQRQVLQDVKAGLLSLTRSQLRDCRRWASSGGSILAVGDIVPLLFAWWSGAPYAFMGTAKSEYYLRTDDAALRPQSSPWPWRRWLDCEYLPWERSLMHHHRCKAVFPRDHLTAQFLKQWPMPVYDLGNPMMDDLEPKGILTRDHLPHHDSVILLLPGSRPPEAYKNWSLMLEGTTPLALQGQQLVFMGAIDTRLDFEPLLQCALGLGWQPLESQPVLDVPHHWLSLGQSHLLVIKQAFNDGLHGAELAIAMAGTATEQFVGLGKPVITLPGEGPQFTWAFAEAQTRLLGPSVHLIKDSAQLPAKVITLLQQQREHPSIYQYNGQQRMGTPGASHRIAQILHQTFL